MKQFIRNLIVYPSVVLIGLAWVGRNVKGDPKTMNIRSLAAFHLFYTRQGDSNAVWFLNRVNADPRNILDNMRGMFHHDQWHPVANEHQICCDRVQVTENDPCILIQHCQTREHIEELVTTLTAAECRDIIDEVRNHPDRYFHDDD